MPPPTTVRACLVVLDNHPLASVNIQSRHSSFARRLFSLSTPPKLHLRTLNLSTLSVLRHTTCYLCPLAQQFIVQSIRSLLLLSATLITPPIALRLCQRTSINHHLRSSNTSINTNSINHHYSRIHSIETLGQSSDYRSIQQPRWLIETVTNPATTVSAVVFPTHTAYLS